MLANFDYLGCELRFESRVPKFSHFWSTQTVVRRLVHSREDLRPCSGKQGAHCCCHTPYNIFCDYERTQVSRCHSQQLTSRPMDYSAVYLWATAAALSNYSSSWSAQVTGCTAIKACHRRRMPCRASRQEAFRMKVNEAGLRMDHPPQSVKTVEDFRKPRSYPLSLSNSNTLVCT